jgi:hypothetical protein
MRIGTDRQFPRDATIADHMTGNHQRTACLDIALQARPRGEQRRRSAQAVEEASTRYVAHGLQLFAGLVREDVMRHTGIYSIIAMVLTLLLFSACSREGADWKSASTADTVESYQQFLQQHPKAPNAAAAQARLNALLEDRDWQSAASADTRVAYEQFVAQHADSKWVQEAKIRIENFAQGATNGSGSATASSQSSAATPIAPPDSAVVHAPARNAAPTKLASAAPKGSAAKTGAATHGNFVQLGAFSTRARAQSEWKQVSARFPDEFKSLKPDYVAGKSKSGTVYRLRVPVSSVAAAKGLCGALKKHAQICVPVTAS